MTSSLSVALARLKQGTDLTPGSQSEQQGADLCRSGLPAHDHAKGVRSLLGGEPAAFGDGLERAGQG